MKSILLLTNSRDTSTDWIVQKLKSRGINFIRLNSDFLDKSSVRVTPSDFLYKDTIGRDWDLLDIVGAVYLRRPDPPVEAKIGCEPTEYAIKQYIEGQWNALIKGLHVLNATWMNPLAENRLSESKILQLHVAKKLGFQLPKTLITNDPDNAKQFASNHKNIVCKALDAPLLELTDHSDFIYSQLLDQNQINFLEDEFRIAPTIFQEAILHKTDIRVTVIGDSTISAEIQCSNNEIDWRRSNPNQIKIVPIDLNKKLQEKCVAMVKSLGLIYGAIDLVKKNNQWYFLELNPSGEWGWLEYAGFPIADSICDTLESFI